MRLRDCAALLATVALACIPPPPPLVDPAELPAVVRGWAAIQGAVHDNITDQRVAGARVILWCACLTDAREVVTDERGIYNFVDLPPGEYVLQVVYELTDRTRKVVLDHTQRFIDRIGVYSRKPALMIVG